MGFWRNTWGALGHLSTLQWLLLILFPTGVFVGLALWLAYLTTFVRMFAPLSYLLVAVVALFLGLIFAGVVIGIAKNLGWSPRRRERKLPARNAPLVDVAMYVARQSAYGLKNVNQNTSVAVVAHELMDRIVENNLTVWGRVGDFAVEPLSRHALEHSSLNLTKGQLRRAGDWGVTEYENIQMNWREVRRTWPRPPIWRRVLERIKSQTASDKVPAA